MTDPTDAAVDFGRLQEAVSFVERELDAGTFPGAALVAERGGRTILERYWGTYCGADRRDVPYDGSVVNMLYSFSKGIAATVVVMAHQDGLIDYDAPLVTYVPEFAGGGKDGITIIQFSNACGNRRHARADGGGAFPGDTAPPERPRQWGPSGGAASPE